MRKTHFIPLFVVAVACTLSAQDVKFPKYRGWVNDFARVISPYYEEKMALLAGEIKRQTGAEMAVVTVQNMSGMSVEDYALRLFQTWGIGDAEKRNGVLLLVAIEERKLRLEVGYGLEGILPDGLVGQILDDYVVPDMREGDYGLGLYRGLAATAQVIAKDAGVQMAERQRPVRRSRSRERSSGGGFFFVIIMIVLMIVTKGRILPWLLLGMMMGGGGGGRGGGGFGGGFGGFGGGMSGGGGASRGF
jgi:uncharacterized protein